MNEPVAQHGVPSDRCFQRKPVDLPHRRLLSSNSSAVRVSFSPRVTRGHRKCHERKCPVPLQTETCPVAWLPSLSQDCIYQPPQESVFEVRLLCHDRHRLCCIDDRLIKGDPDPVISPSFRRRTQGSPQDLNVMSAERLSTCWCSEVSPFFPRGSPLPAFCTAHKGEKDKRG